MTADSIRRPAVDIARGIAVMGMMVEHLIPTEGAPGQLGRWVNIASGWFTGKSAALFFVLAGMSWALQMDQRPNSEAWSGTYLGYISRRAAGLIAVGLILHLTVWPTEVLVAIGCALPIAILVRRGGDRAVWVAVTVIAVSIPFVSTLARPWVARDWNDLGEPLLTWASCFRLIVFDGCYPLVPWLSFIFVGMLAIRIETRKSLWSLWAATLALVVCGFVNHLQPAMESPLAIEWVPTSIPFLLVCGGTAFAVVFGIEALPKWIARLSWSRWMACYGRMSLSHYLGHILLVVLPLRHWYPTEEWPTRVGVISLAAYLVFAIPASALWLGSFKRGPVEWLLSLSMRLGRNAG